MKNAGERAHGQATVASQDDFGHHPTRMFAQACRSVALGFVLPAVLVLNVFCVCMPTSVTARAVTSPGHACCDSQGTVPAQHDSSPAAPTPASCAHCGQAQIGEITSGTPIVAPVTIVHQLGRTPAAVALGMHSATGSTAAMASRTTVLSRPDIVLANCALLL